MFKSVSRIFGIISAHKKVVFSLVILLGLLSVPLVVRSSAIVIAITQIAPHPSLDRIRQGIQDELKASGLNVRFVVENANGNIATATQIAQRFVSLQPDLIVAISTPSAQTVYNLAKPKNIPVIFGAVSDPIQAKLISSFEKAGEGITGVADTPPLKEQIELMQEVKPDIKAVGFIYNPGETNSTALLPLLAAALKEQRITLLSAPASSIIEVPAAVSSLVGRVDVIYVSNDNMVVSGLDGLLKVAFANKVPVFASDPESVGRRALMAVAPDQYQMGRQTGEMVVRYLRTKKLESLRPEKVRSVQTALNLAVAQELGITIPEIVQARAQTVVETELKTN